MDLVTVPVKAELTELEEFVLDHCLDYGIIAGGFAAYLYNPEKKASDIDLFVNNTVDSDAYDRLYHHLGAAMSFYKKLKWRMVSEHPKQAQYNDDMEVNRVTFRPYPPRKTMSDDYGWRLMKYVEFKGYDMSFKDMLTIFGLVPDKKKFYDQLWRSGHKIQNDNLVALGNYIKLMFANDPMWRNDKGDF